MGLSHIIPAGVVFIPLVVIVMAIPDISNTILQINEAALDVSELENSILNTHFELSNLSATGDSNTISFNVTNIGNTKLWDYDNFDLIVTYEGVVGTSSTNVTERLSYTETAPTGDPIEFDDATGFNDLCIVCSFDHTVTSSGSDRILIVAINTQSGSAINSVTYNGDAMTQIGNEVNNGDSAHVTMWYRVNPDTGTHPVELSLAIVTAVAAGAVSFTGVDQTAPIDAYSDATGTSATPSVTLATTTDEAWIIDVVGTQNGPMTTGTGQIERWDELQGSTIGAGSTEFTSSAGTFSMDWTNDAGSTNWAMLAAAIKPAATPCCVTIGDWNIEDISVDSIDPDIINNNETASIQGKTSYQMVDNGKMTITFSTDNGARASAFVTPS
jgi:archaellum component FlaF (FlaF/FlaG flagellin family)